MGVTNPLPFRGPYLDEYPLTLDGTSQVIVAQPLAQRYFKFQNPLGNAAVTLNPAGGDATASGFLIQPGETFTLEGGCDRDITVAGTIGEEVFAVAGNY
jgi:hypothetical protein